MKKFCLLACCAVLGGCMHAPPVEVKKEPAAPVVKQQPREELSIALVEKSIVKGKTTKKEVLEKLGPPNGASFNYRRHVEDPNTMDMAQLLLNERTAEYWNYWTPPPMDIVAKGGNFRIFRVTIFFDDDGVVVDYEAGEKTGDAP